MLTSKRSSAWGSEEARKPGAAAMAVVQPCTFLILRTRAGNKNCVSCAAGQECDPKQASQNGPQKVRLVPETVILRVC